MVVQANPTPQLILHFFLDETTFVQLALLQQGNGGGVPSCSRGVGLSPGIAKYSHYACVTHARTHIPGVSGTRIPGTHMHTHKPVQHRARLQLCGMGHMTVLLLFKE